MRRKPPRFRSISPWSSRGPGLSALVLRFGLAGVAVASAIVGWVLFGDTDPCSVGAGRRRLLAGAGTHACGHRLLNRRRRTTRISQGTLARRRFVDLRTAGRACPAVCRALVGQNAEARGVHRFIGVHYRPSVLANSIATDLFMGLSLTVLPQLYPDGPLPGRLWKVLLGISTGLVAIAALRNAYDFPTIDDQVEWYFWSTVVGVGWLIALASLSVRWRRGSRLLRRQIVGFATVTVIMIAVNFLSATAYAPFPYLQPIVIFALWPPAVVISIAIAVLQYHLYDVRLVIRRVVVYGGLTVALTALFVGVYFAVLAALSGQVVAVRYRWVAVVAATVAVLAAEPVRRRIQTRLERRFLGERGDPLGVLARLHAALSNG